MLPNEDGHQVLDQGRAFGSVKGDMKCNFNIDFRIGVIFVNGFLNSTQRLLLPLTLPTFHDSDRVLHLGSKNVWSKHSGEVLDAHLVFVAVRLHLI